MRDEYDIDSLNPRKSPYSGKSTKLSLKRKQKLGHKIAFDGFINLFFPDCVKIKTTCNNKISAIPSKYSVWRCLFYYS